LRGEGMKLGEIRVLEKSAYIHLEDGGIFVVKGEEIEIKDEMILIRDEGKIVSMFKRKNVKSVNINFV
jgi:hypothetical protein